MSSMKRRRFVASAGSLTVGSLAGCTMFADQSPPAGSLRFENDHSVPHLIRLAVTDVGSEPGTGASSLTGSVTIPAPQRTLTASMTVSPGEGHTYDSIFTESVWYSVQFTVDEKSLEDNARKTHFNPAAVDDGSYEFLTGHVYESGEFSWEVRTTDNAGSFS